MNNFWISSLAIVVLSTAGCNKSDNKAPPRQPQEVGVYIIKSTPYTLTTDLPGRTSAYRVAEVRPQVNGIIKKRLFEEGGKVGEGQQLYQIDPAIYEADVKRAYANLVSARALEKRYKLLVKDKAVSQQQYDDAHAALLQAEANFQTAQVNLRYTKVLAPITGIISRSYVTEGALATAGQASPMATINKLDPIYVDVTQPSKELLRLREEFESGKLEKAGDSAAIVSLILEDGSAYELKGKLEFHEVSVSETTGSVTIRATFDNPKNKLLPGMFVHARLNEGVREKAILVPQMGVTRNIKGQATAMIVDKDNKVQERTLEVSRTADNRWLVDNGLNEGDKVIIRGLQYVQRGNEVVVKDETASLNNDNQQNVGKSGQ